MKKVFSLSIGLLLSFSVFAIEGYQLKDEPCSNGNTYKACRYVPDADCSIMEQTFCDDSPLIGG
jgi:hypothetical protein